MNIQFQNNETDQMVKEHKDKDRLYETTTNP